ncbi:hypothetical protein KDD93_08950 [Campylobacter sp. faydin G-24]|uniref:Lipoprotein n=1 Tax=Campylobacter anatolicus TaxID=2829105 RepID=A0ABS5HKQ1_9BACT|nr:hypothetical protein [Campylobacter anatolicus]MBR8464686.1 hypothetical protein [Campylobacter anatolicus]
MRVRNMMLMMVMLANLNGCNYFGSSYENFKYFRNIYSSKHNNRTIVKKYSERREIYDENRYIYKFQGKSDPRCIYGYLTNRDDKPEVVQEWIILSGKEYCKERPNWFIFKD